MKRRGFFRCALALLGLKAFGAVPDKECTKRIWRIETFPGKAAIIVDYSNRKEHQEAILLWCQLRRKHPNAKLNIEKLRVTSSWELTG